MSDLQSQLNLLNDYIRTLQKENQSKTNQIRTLTEQNNSLIKQCESLRTSKTYQSTTVLSSTTNSHFQTTITKLQNELKQSKAAYTLLYEQTQQGSQVQKLREDVRRLTQEKFILQQYKEKLEKDLRQLGFKSFDTYLSKMKQLQTQIDQGTRKLRTFQTKIVDYQRKTTLLSNEIMVKNSEIERLNDKIKTISQNGTSSKNYQIKLSEYENKITQLTTQISVTRSEIQRLKQKESQFIIIQRQNDKYKSEISSLNLKINSLSSTTIQLNTFQTTINNLKNQQKDWERDRQQLNIKISDLQTQIVEKANTIAQLRLREEFFKSKQSSESQKDREIQNLTTNIRSLKADIEEYRRTISQKESNIRSLQMKVSSSEYSKTNEISTIQRIVEQKNSQMNRLIEVHNQKITSLTLELEKHKSISIVHTQNTTEISALRDENNFLKREAQNNQILIQELQRQKENLKARIRELDEQLSRSRVSIPQVKTYVSKTDTGETELTKLVRELRFQLEDVKKSNAVIHEENHKMHQYLTELTQSQIQVPHFGNENSVIRYHSPQHLTSLHHEAMISSPSEIRMNLPSESIIRQTKHFHGQPYFKSEMNLDKKRQRINQSSMMSPTRDVKSPQINKNREKWESLQRKISALRVENDELKRTLLYE